MISANPDLPQILLATGNAAKQETLRWLLEGAPVRPVTPAEAGVTADPDESGETHLEIARQKAREWSEAGSMLVIASDGGLTIPALGANWESRHTRRFAGPSADDRERARRLLEVMAPLRGEDRAASWVEAVAVADRGEALASWELTGATGYIVEEAPPEVDVSGFWVFSLWRFPRFGKIYHELTPEEKAALDDHWTRLRELVREWFASGWVSRA
jgi:XTP/dITP diphosphohydrolase